MSSSGISAKKWKNDLLLEQRFGLDLLFLLHRVFPTSPGYSQGFGSPRTCCAPCTHHQLTQDRTGEHRLRTSSCLLPRQLSKDSASRTALSHTEDTVLSFCQSSLSAGAAHSFSVHLSASAPGFGGFAASPSPVELSSFWLSS